MELPFPKMTREENQACKLTDENIADIQARHGQGEGYATIAKDYNVTPQAIYYWCLASDRRKAMNKEHNLKAPPITSNPAWHKEYRQRKLKNPKFVEYEKMSAMRYKSSPLTHEQYLAARKRQLEKEKMKRRNEPEYKKKRYAVNMKWREKVGWNKYQLDYMHKNYIWSKELQKYIKKPL